MPDRHLLTPRTLDDMLLYAMWHLQTSAGQVVTRVVEGEFGVTRRQWRVLALLATHEGVLSSQLAERSGLDRATVQGIMASLASRAQRRAVADIVVCNDTQSLQELQAQADRIAAWFGL